MAGKRCNFGMESDDQCKTRAAPFAGKCAHCPNIYCTSHRLPEHHSCAGMDSCRQQAFEKNKARLESEQTVASKIVMA